MQFFYKELSSHPRNASKYTQTIRPEDVCGADAPNGNIDTAAGKMPKPQEVREDLHLGPTEAGTIRHNHRYPEGHGHFNGILIDRQAPYFRTEKNAPTSLKC